MTIFFQRLGTKYILANFVGTVLIILEFYSQGK
jgi:hypothetical protein